MIPNDSHFLSSGFSAYPIMNTYSFFSPGSRLISILKDPTGDHPLAIEL